MIVFIGDVHLQATNPVSRTDKDYTQTLLGKLEWCFQRALELEADCVFFLGDLGHIRTWSVDLIDRTADIFEKYGIPKYTIIGNHDQAGYNLSTMKGSGLAMLERLKVLTVLYPKMSISYGNISIYPYSAGDPDTYKLIEGNTLFMPKNYGISVAAIHAPVGPVATPNIKYYKDIEINDYDFAIFGDIHGGFEIYKSKTGCILANPGAVCRRTRGKDDLYRIPKICILNKEGKIWYEDIPCKHIEEVFDMDIIEADWNEIGNSFLAAEAKSQILEELDVEDLTRLIGEEVGYSKNSIDLLIEEYE